VTDSPPRRYASPAAFRAALKQALQAQARLFGRLFDELNREFLLQRFLARVFHQDATQWVLKVASGCSSGCPAPGTAQIWTCSTEKPECRTLSRAYADARPSPDWTPFTFQLSEPKPMTGGVAGVTVTVQAFLGTTL
jgi:hypothetical protein